MKRFLKVVAIIIIVLAIAFLVSPSYLRKALIYQYAGIDDHTHFYTRVVKTGTPLPWKVSANYNTKKICDTLHKAIEAYKTIAFVIVQNDSLRYEEYWDTYSDSSITNAFSATKSIISLLIGIAIDEGKIKSVDQKVTDFFPEFAEGYGKDLTIKHLLTMSSGLNWDESYGSPFSKTTQAYYGSDLKKLIFSLKVVEQPGKVFNYLSGNTQLLAFILEKATAMHLADYASEKLWKPLGAQHDALWYLDKKDGMEKSYCCFSSNARDLARIGQMVLDSGKYNGKQVISYAYLSQALAADTFLIDQNKNTVDYYGYQWWIVEYNGMKIPFARGILGQYIFVIPNYNAVVVRLGHLRDSKYKNQMPLDVFTYLDAAMEVLK
jgi:CubicO group peptidase (beta-lactamase class C family)